MEPSETRAKALRNSEGGGGGGGCSRIVRNEGVTQNGDVVYETRGELLFEPLNELCYFYWYNMACNGVLTPPAKGPPNR